MHKLKLIWILLFLTNFVGCSTQPTKMIVETKTIKVYPPSALLQEPDAPDLVDIVVTDDIIKNKDAFKLAYQKAVSQIEKIRQWVEEAKKSDK